MKIKRTFAGSMGEALKKVRAECGPDAVILSTKKLENGVEVISAIDYDEEAVQNAAARSGAGSPGGFDWGDRSLKSESAALRQSMSRSNQTSQEGSSIFDTDLKDDVVSLTSTHSSSRPPMRQSAQKAEKKPVHKQSFNRPSVSSSVEWNEDPAIAELRNEIRSLRGLFEDQLAVLEWGGMSRRNPNRATLLKRFHAMGLSRKVSKLLADNIGDDGRELESVWQQSLSQIIDGIEVTDDDIVEQGGIVSVVGPTGVGKTTTVAKLAARYTLRHGKGQVALVTTDSFRIGAHDQLRSFGKILGVPVYVAGDAEELQTVIESLADKPLVLIDTAGMSQRDVALAEQLNAIESIRDHVKTYLVLSANTQLSTMNEAVKSFRRISLAGSILTKVDESASLGNALSVLLQHRLSVAYVGTGQRVPEDIQPARADLLVDKAVSLAEAEAEDDEELAVAFAGANYKRG